MKQFKTLFEADAKDYKGKKDSDAEGKGEKHQSGDEQKFADSHKVDVKDHPTAGDTAHVAKNAPDGEKEKAGEKKALKSYKDHISKQGETKASKHHPKNGDIKPEKVKEGVITLKDGSEIELTADLAEKWNEIIPSLNAENQTGIASLAMRDTEGFNSVTEFVGA